MTTPTRYALYAGVTVLGAGLLAGAVAYVTSTGAVVAQSGPDELRYVPVDANLVAYANVRAVMASSFRARLRGLVPPASTDSSPSSGQERGPGPQWFQEATGVDLETDIDYLVFSLVPGKTDTDSPDPLGLMVGRFDAPRLQDLALEYGGTVQQYAEHAIVTGVATGDENETQVAMSFVESGVLALGAEGLVRRAIDVSRGRVSGDVTTNERLMRLMTQIRAGHNTWAVAEFDGVEAAQLLPEQMRAHVPPLTALALGGQVNGGVSTTLTVETRDEQAAQDLHQVVQGLVALARMQVTSYPELQPFLESVQLTGEGSTVTATLDASADLIDVIFSTAAPDGLAAPGGP